VSARAALGWLAAAALAATYAVTSPEPPEPRAGAEGPLRRLIGPFAGLAAEVQWVRFQHSAIAGRTALAIEHAETAIELDPGAPRGYELLASHLAFDLASQRVEPDPARRSAWVRAGLAVAARGEARSRDPSAMAFLQGFILKVRAETDPDIEWPGGSAALLREAEEHFARALAYR
jgi:hypothetical protein